MIQSSHPIFSSYSQNPKLLDEIFDNDGNVKEVYKKLFEIYSDHSIEDFASLNNNAKTSFFNQGITFQVYGEQETKERSFHLICFPE